VIRVQKNEDRCGIELEVVSTEQKGRVKEETPGQRVWMAYIISSVSEKQNVPN